MKTFLCNATFSSALPVNQLTFRWRGNQLGSSWHYKSKSARLRKPSSRAAGSTGTPLVHGPPESYDFRKDIDASSNAIINKLYPQLQDLVQEGCLIVYQRPEDYVERRTDGYQEPELVFVVGTAHISQRSANIVERVIEAVRPESVVVELCRSRSAALNDPEVLSRSATHGDAATAQTGGAGGRGPHTQVVGVGAGMVVGAASEVAAEGSGQDAGAGAGASGRAASSNMRGTTSAEAGDVSGGSSNMASSSGSGMASRISSGSSSGSSGSSMASSSGSSSSSVGDMEVPVRSEGKAVGPVMLSGGSFWEAAFRSVRLGGQSALVLQLLLALLYRNASGAMGLAPGAEFRAASRAAEVVGAQLVLGDRPIEITLRRAWQALSPQQRLRLMKELLTAGLSRSAYKELSEDNLQEMMTDTFLSAAFKALGQQYPELLSPLVHERDLYLAWSLKRSKAVNGTKRVVGVVGRGHLRGVVYALVRDEGKLRFKDLVGERKTGGRFAANVAGRVVGEVLLGLGLYAAWTAFVP